MAQQQAIHKFVLGNKEEDGKNAEFQYDHGWYSIVLINGEEKEILYKSRNAQEAYMKWNVYIGRKKERPVREYTQNDGDTRDNRNYRDRRRSGGAQEDGRGRRNGAQEDNRSRRSSAQEDNRSRRNSTQDESRSRRNNTQDSDHSPNGTKNVQSDRSRAEKEEERRINNSAEAHRNFEKRKAKARKDWSRRRKAEEGELK